MKKIILFFTFLYFSVTSVVFAQNSHPNNLVTSLITSTSAELSWNGAGCSQNILFSYRPVPGSWPPPSGNITVTNPHQLTGLLAGGNYEWRVKCQGTSGWSSVQSFQTTGGPSWNCINGFCVDPGDGSGIYNTISSCQSSCPQPSLGNITETSSIACNGGQADIRIDVNGVTGVNAKVIIGFYIGNTFSAWTSPQAQDFLPPNNDYVNINGVLHARDWVIRLVDSLTYYDPQGLNAFGQTIIGPAANSNILGDLTGVFDEINPYTILEPTQLSALDVQVLSNLCNGDCDAQQRIEITGGTSPYTYSWSDGSPPSTTVNLPTGQNVDTIKNLCADSYNLSITDANGCQTGSHQSQNPFSLLQTNFIVSNNDFLISEPLPIAPGATPYLINQNGLHISCNGGSDGTINLTTSGGTNPYQYSIDGGVNFQSSTSFPGLTAGSYTVLVRDFNSCDETQSVVLVEPSLLVLSLVSATPPLCYGDATGVISVAISGGAGNESYSVDGGLTFPYNNTLLGSLNGGITYDVYVQDGNSCEDSISVNLTTPSEIVFTTSVSDYNGYEISCFSGNDGLITFNPPSGGNPPYEYSIDGGTTWQNSNTFNTLTSGTYNTQVRDANLCVKQNNIVLNEPSQIFANALVTSPSCNGVSDGTILLQPIGGVMSTYSNYQWIQIPSLSSPQATGLSAGLYLVSFDDANGCSGDTSISLNDPSAISANISTTDEFCNDVAGAINITNLQGGTPFSSGNPYIYSWTGPNSFTSSNANLTAISAGSYNVTITDQNGCDLALNNIQVINNLPFELSFTSTETCPGNQSGTATVVVNPLSGNTLTSQTYQWTVTGQSTIISTLQAVSSLAVGSYTCTVTDASFPGCSISGPVNVDTSAVAVKIDNLELVEISCHNATDGEITVHASGGTPPYTFSINGISNGSDSVFSNLSSNSYTLRVEDNVNCYDELTIIIDNPLPLSIDTILVNPITCHGESNASIQSIIVNGGNSPYQYSINGGLPRSNMSYFINYGPGNYTVEVKDENNCFTSDILIITEPSPLSVSIVPSLWNNYQVRCYEDTNSYANIYPSGGISPYMFLCVDLINSDTVYYGTSSLISNLRHGEYEFYVMDSLSCLYTESIIYHQPSPIQHNFIPTHVTCEGWSNGSLIDSVYGGVGGSINSYTYMWNSNPQETDYYIDSIAVGDHFVTVMDANNCMSTDTFSSINANNALSVSINTSLTKDVSCFNYCDGEISVFVSGGVANINSNGDSIYTYLWNDTLFQNTVTATGLCVNNNTNSTSYSCIVTDLTGCSDTVSYTISQNIPVSVTATLVTEILCYDDSTGRVTANATGGAGSFEYMWSNNFVYNSSPNNPLSASSGIPVGNYIVTAKDQNGCVATDSIELIQPPEMELVVSSENVSCYGFGDGIISAQSSGGTPFLGIPPEYIYNYYDNLGNLINTIQSDISESNNLTPGIYRVQSQDMNGCIIQSGSLYISEPSDSLTLLFSTVDDRCSQNSGEITVFAYGGTEPYQYLWDNGGNTTQLSSLSAGYYSIVITDANNCLFKDSVLVKGTQNVFLPDNQSSITYEICLGDSVFIDIDEKTSINYLWDDGSTVADRWVFPSKRTNQYQLIIDDPFCSDTYSVYANVNVDFVDAKPTSNPSLNYGPHPVIVNGDAIQIFSDNNYCDEYNWVWQDGATSSQSFNDNPESSSWYYISVDSAGCLGYDSIYVVVGVLPYEGITPNNDGYNDTWTPRDIESYPEAIIKIFNRWGGLIFESNGGVEYKAWDGTNNGKELPVGTYYYIIDLKTEDEPQTGPITIIR